MYTRKTEIRHLTAADVYSLAVILDATDSWKKLMRIIPKDLDAPPEETIEKYTGEHMKLIENASMRLRQSCTEILIDEWGTSGRRRPTIWDLRELLVRANLYRAADFVSERFLKEPPPPRPKTGPAARVDTSLPLLDTQQMKQVEGAMENMTYPASSELRRNALVRTDLNNEDFYEKCRPCRNKVCVEKSDMIKFSVQGEASTKICDGPSQALEKSDMIKFSKAEMTLGNIPSISTLLDDSGAQKISHREDVECNQCSSESMFNGSASRATTSKADIPAISALLDKSSMSTIGHRSTFHPDSSSSSSESETTEEINSSLNNIPMLSALHGPSTSRGIRDDSDISINLPNLSALNLGSDSEATNSRIVSAKNFHLPMIRSNASTIEMYSSTANIPNLSMIVGRCGTDEPYDMNANIPNLSMTESNVEMRSSNANLPNLSIIGKDIESSLSYTSNDNLQPNLSIFNNIQENSMSSTISSGLDKSERSQRLTLSQNESEEYIPQLSILQQ